MIINKKFYVEASLTSLRASDDLSFLILHFSEMIAFDEGSLPVRAVVLIPEPHVLQHAMFEFLHKNRSNSLFHNFVEVLRESFYLFRK